MTQDNLKLLITLVSTLGGIEGIKGIITWYRTRRAERRKVEAQATAVEVNNLGVVVQNLSTQLTQLNERLNARDKKIDEIYEKYRKEQEDHLHTLHLFYQEQFFRCEVEECLSRQPPRLKLVKLLQQRQQSNPLDNN